MTTFRQQRLEREDGSAVCEKCVIADNPVSRLVGLLGRSELEIGEGLLMRPAFSIHTSFMRFPIDAVFLDKELSVIRVAPKLKPWRAAAKAGAHAILELPAGETKRRDIQVLDRMRLIDPRARLASGGGLVEAPLRQIRVGLVSRDRRFLRVACFLLARHGHHVEAARDAASIHGAVERAELDVAVLDASGSFGATARNLRALRALDPGLGVVVVDDEAEHTPAQSVTVVDKWESFEAIVAEIERQFVRVNGYP